MMATTMHTAVTAAAMALLVGRAHAEPDAEPVPEGRDEVIYVHGTRPAAGLEALDGAGTAHADADRALTEPAFVTVVRVDDRAGETVTVAEVLAKSVGVNTRSLGGLGSFSSVSVRGASPMHTAISIDGVPLSRVAAASVDLSGFELASFSQVEVYRGGIPVALGGAALGGAVNFATALGPDASGDRIHLSAGAGSFGARHLRARWGEVALDDRLALHVSAGYRGAEGDYEFFDDNGTSLNLDDDGYVERSNNGFDQVDAVARARYRSRGWAVEGGARTLVKQQGVPGRGSNQTERADLATFSQLVDARVDRALGDTAVGGTAYLLFERQRFTDLLGEVGIGVEDHRYHTFAGGTGGRVSHPLGAHQRINAGVEGRLDVFTDDDRIDDANPSARGYRWGGALSLADEVALAGDRVVVVPAVRVDALRTDPGDAWDPIIVDPEDQAARTDVFASPRLAARARVADGMVVKSSAGRYFRPPTLIELFGDRGFLVGNAGLKPETGVSADLGVAYAPAGARGPIDRIYGQAAVFGARPRDAIGFVPSAGRVAVALNLDDADLYGAELSVTGRLWRRATASANYTFVDSRQDSSMPSYDGKRLPLRPRHQAYGRVDVAQRVAGRLAVVWGDVSYTSGNFLDAANQNQVPARLFLGAGLKLSPMRGVVVAVEGKNLTDERVETISLDPPPRPDLAEVPQAVADVLGYPLPGRSLYLSVDWSF